MGASSDWEKEVRFLGRLGLNLAHLGWVPLSALLVPLLLSLVKGWLGLVDRAGKGRGGQFFLRLHPTPCYPEPAASCQHFVLPNDLLPALASQMLSGKTP